MVAEERPKNLRFLDDFEGDGSREETPIETPESNSDQEVPELEMKPLKLELNQPENKKIENPKLSEIPETSENSNSDDGELEEIENGKGLPRGTIKRLMKDLTDLNVSQSAVEQMAEILEDEIKSIMVIAVHESKKENMKTIKGRHVKKSYNLILKEILAKVVKSTKKTEYIIKELVTNLILDIPEDTPIELKGGKDE